MDLGASLRARPRTRSKGGNRRTTSEDPGNQSFNSPSSRQPGIQSPGITTTATTPRHSNISPTKSSARLANNSGSPAKPLHGKPAATPKTPSSLASPAPRITPSNPAGDAAPKTPTKSGGGGGATPKRKTPAKQGARTPGKAGGLATTPRSLSRPRPDLDHTPTVSAAAGDHHNHHHHPLLPCATLVSSTPRYSSTANSQPRFRRPPITGRIVEVFRSLPFSSKFDLVEEIGEGTFSTVYMAKRKGGETKIALKHLVPTSKSNRVIMEVKCMEVGGVHPNIIQLLGDWRYQGDIIFAMPYIHHSRFSELLYDIELFEIQEYIGNLLSALQYIHKLGIVHRDIKPNNFLFDRDSKKYALVDFGLAQHLSELTVKEDGRGSKRKADEEPEAVTGGGAGGQGGKRGRAVLTEMEANSSSSRLNCSPRTRVLRELKSSVRRSPRKLDSPGKEDQSPAPSSSRLLHSPRLLLSPSRLTASAASAASTVTPQQVKVKADEEEGEERMLMLGPGSRSTPPVRQSPRKHHHTLSLGGGGGGGSAGRPGYSKLTITANSILSGAGGGGGAGAGGTTPSPSSHLPRTPSFTMLEPASYAACSQTSQTTDTFQGRTYVLRASLTSTCSSAVLPSGHAVPLPAAAVSSSTSASNQQPTVKVTCTCNGKPQVCATCLSQPHMHAPRAGTPGFRAPEVLLKYSGQTTAIDIWAVGVILLCFLSRSYPFFRAPDDMTAISEIAVLFGTKNVKEVAKRYGRRLLFSNDCEGQDLAEMCNQLNQRPDFESDEEFDSSESDEPVGPILATDEATSLLSLLLRLDHTHRITADEALEHPFLRNVKINRI